MSDYSDYQMIEAKIREGMYQGNMHKCIRDVGNIAGGCLAANRITRDEMDALGRLAVSLSLNKAEGRRKWEEATSFGMRRPLHRTELFVAPDAGHSVGWDESINPNDYKIIDQKFLEVEVIEEPSSEWNSCAQLHEYISLLFEPDDHVAYCTDPFERDGKWIPTKGVCHKTANEILSSLKKGTKDGFEEAVGTPNEKCGAWIVINPVDGKGRKNENVTDFRYALVESDDKSIDDQVAIYRKLELPCVCIVHSGGKSAHAIVRVNASSYDEYVKRVNFLYEVCEHNGLSVDKQNRNPSRYSRMPGVMRNGNKQFIIDRNCGKASWDEWENWVKDLNDDLPDFEPLTGDLLGKDLPELPPTLIDGILRKGGNMIISGPPKAGKSFMLLDLAISIAEGEEWLGHKCTQGRVLYINLELERAECLHRLSAIYDARGKRPTGKLAIELWQLRGKALPLDKLAPKLIRRSGDNRFSTIIIDPAYQVFTGDENSAEDTGLFMKSLIKIASSCNATVILCHHHSKGSQDGKSSMDRSSGSGVFSRSPDAILDLLPLDTSTSIMQVMREEEAMAMCDAADDCTSENWKASISSDDMADPNRLAGCLEQIFNGNETAMDRIRKARLSAREECMSYTGWRLSFTLRSFRSPAPQNLWFKFPRHELDDMDTLKDAEAEGSRQSYSRRKKAKEPKISKIDAFKQIVLCNPGETWTLAKAMERFEVKETSIRHWCSKLGWRIQLGVIVPKEGEK